MIALFPSLRAGEILFCVLGMSLVYGLRQQGISDLICMSLLFGVLLLVFFGFRLAAVFRHQKLVNILYRQMDPERFIAAYEPLLKKAAGKPKLESTIRNFLSTGYASKGSFEKAIALLEETPEVKGSQAVRGQALKLSNLCNIYVLAGDAAKAEETLHAFERFIAQDENKEAGGDMQGNLVTLRNYVQAVRGWNADEAFLKKMSIYTAEPYHQTNNRYQWAMAQLACRKRSEAKENFALVAQRAPKLYIGKEAARRLELLEQREATEHAQEQ